MIELTVNDLHLQYGNNPVLKGVSMQLQKGEVVSLLGPSGSGKTTLLRAVAGLEQASQGTVQIGDRVMFDGTKKLDVPAEGRNLGLVFQSYALWPHKTVAENVAYPLKLRKTPSAQIKERVQAVLQQLGLGHLGERFPSQLSGGQQQRVAIARALVYNPPVILLDEPLSNLDAKLREEARAFLRELIVRLGLSALMVTHDQSEAMAMSDRILLLNNGVIEQQGTPEQMYGAPETLFTAEFMGSNNRVNGKIAEVRDGMARLVDEAGGWSLWGVARGDLKPGASAHGVIRLEQVRVGVDNADNTIRLPLATRMYLGDRWECLFRASGATGTGLRAYASSAPTDGQYALTFPREQFWLYAA
ncbi:ABC transporter ATP-binding protein [Ralstonia sp. 25C]|uniref:ABC transporter ATP-binding protein n=1 Tax=Ralstonia sp. 25C TaxID=3447363 RepID=UPI003F74B820